MSFLSAVFLLGLPLMSVPVIIHLLNRRRRRLIRWGAMRFLLEAVPRRRRIWSPSDLLLMLLRAAAVALFVLALAQPLVKGSWLGSTAPRDVILVLDRSLSTSRAEGKGTRFDAILSEADRTIDRLDDSDVVRVLLGSSTTDWLVPVAEPVNAESKRQLLARLHQVKPSLGSADMMRCLREALDTESANDQKARVVVVLTDGQAYGWHADTISAWEMFRDTSRSLPIPASVNVKVVRGSGRAVTNLSVESVAAPRPFVGVEEKIVLTALVKNRGSVPTDATLMSWADGENPIGATPLPALEPGETATVDVAHSFEEPGVHEVTCKSGRPDDLVMDNTGRVILEVVETIPILVVDGRNQSRSMGKETGFLLAALGRAPTDDEQGFKSVFRPRVIKGSDLESEQLGKVRCIVLGNVSRLTVKAMENLSNFVRRGGGVWLALGDEVDRSWFNDAVFSQGKGLSPLPLDDPEGDENDQDTFVVIHPPTTQHPATRLLGDTHRLDIDRARIYRRHRFAQPQRRNVSVLLRTANGSPLTVEKSFGRGRVIVQGIPLGVGWSNLPLCQAFLPMAHEYLSYLVEPTSSRWNLNLGEALTVSLPLELSGRTGEVLTPHGDSTKVTTRVEQGRCVCRYTRTFWVGKYTLLFPSETAKTREFPFQVFRDPEESNLASLTEDQTKALGSTGKLQFVSNPLTNAKGDDSLVRPEPIWTWLLLALLLVMLSELVLSWRLGRRSLRKTPVLQMH